MDIAAIDKGIVILYFAGTLGLAVVVSRRVHTWDEFLVAGRRLSVPLLVCTLVSTYYGLGVLLAGSEISYEAGIVSFVFDTAPAYLLVLVMALFIAGRVRRLVEGRSIPDLVHAHYGLPARLCAAAACFLYALPAFSILGLGGLFALLFGIPFEWAMLLGTILTLVYTVLGGLMAVAATDAIQFLIMAVTLAIAGGLGLWEVGGLTHMVDVLPDHFRPGGERPLALLVVYAMTSLSVLVEPAFYQRIFAAASPRAVVKALCLGIVLWMAYDWTITILGIGARTAVTDGLIAAPSSPDQAVTQFVIHVLPAGLTGLFCAGLAAAAMSTMDSYLLISASTLVYDMWQPLRRRPMRDHELVRNTRVFLVLAAAANIALCLWFRNVERLWIFMTAVLICTCLIPVMAALFIDGVRRRSGAVATTLGFVLVLAYYLWVDWAGTWVEEEAAYLWQGDLFGMDVSLHQDYGILYILPIVGVVFATFQWGTPRIRRRSAEAG